MFAPDEPVRTEKADGPIPGARPGPGRWWRRPRLVDAAVLTGYLLAAVGITVNLWRPDRMVHMRGDQILFEWMLARAARAVVHLENPLHSAQLNAPDGVNLMANTSVLGLGLPLTPVTLLFGSRTAFVVAVVGCLAGTAAAWYLLLSRCLVRSRTAATIGGLFCGFAPGMISQAGGHLHMIAQFLVPAILWAAFSDGTAPRPRRGVLLGVLVTVQVFLGEEVLVFLVLAAALFAGAHAVADRSSARRRAVPLAGRLAVGAVTAAVPLAWPLWFQFLGPGHYRGLPFDPAAYTLDVRSFTAAARQSVTGHDVVPGLLSPNPTEENSFFGLALIALCAVVVLWLWHQPMVRALAVCGVVFALLSLGPVVRYDGRPTGLPGPYRLLADVPLLDMVVPARFPLVCVPVIAILLALSIDRLSGAPAGTTAPPTGATAPPAGIPGPSPRAVPVSGAPASPRLRRVWTGAVLAVLLPLVPVPIRTEPVPPVPRFLLSGEWRRYVPPGRTMVAVPPTTGAEATAGMYWSARTGVPFHTPGGYFIGPTGPDDPTARWGAPDRPTALLLDRVAHSGRIPPIGAEQRRQAVEDLRYWRAAVVVQGGLRNGEAVRHAVDQLLGPGRSISGAWVWDVRDLVR